MLRTLTSSLNLERCYSLFRQSLHGFDPNVGIASSRTPPHFWYTDPTTLEHEKRLVFGNKRQTVTTNNWVPIGLASKVNLPGNYVHGQFLDEPYVVVNDNSKVRAFYNVCQHHAARLVVDEESKCNDECKTIEKFVCPYHGWRYRLDGRLEAATKLKGIKNFKASQIRLQDVHYHQWGPLMFLKFFNHESSFPDMNILNDRIKPFLNGMDISEFEKEYTYYKTITYRIKCNWKVFVENYLDGGYHVKHLHHGLAGQLEEGTYKIECFDHYSVQSCESSQNSSCTGIDFQERIGDLGALYAYVYPNWMINVYAPMADINAVMPISVDETDVIYYYFIRKSHAHDRQFVERAIQASHQVQLEDSAICESVQKGLKSSSYMNGYYAPELEHAAYHFHQMLYRDLTVE